MDVRSRKKNQKETEMLNATSAALRWLACLGFCLCVAAAAFAASTTENDSSWYKTARFSCDDPLSLTPAYLNGSWFRKDLDVQLESPANERGYVPFRKADYNFISQQQYGTFFEKHTLTKEESATLRKLLLSIANDKVVPVTISLTSAMLGYLKAGNFGTTGFLNHLTAVDAAEKINARILAELTAAGGNINRVLTATKTSDNKPYLILAFEYAIHVGSEDRHYVTASCSYPVKLLFSEFRTTDPVNKSILRYVSGTTWQFIDAETNKPKEVWTEIGRDDDYLYFVQKGRDTTNTYRLGINNGPIQKQEGKTWYYTYHGTVAD